MKKKFISKVQTCFKTPKVSFHHSGRMRQYSKKVYLAVGHCVTVRDSHEVTEEGYSETHVLVENRSGVLYREITNRSRDCDGAYSSFKEEKLSDGVWIDVSSSQRDHAAEAMGY